MVPLIFFLLLFFLFFCLFCYLLFMLADFSGPWWLWMSVQAWASVQRTRSLHEWAGLMWITGQGPRSLAGSSPSPYLWVSSLGWRSLERWITESFTWWGGRERVGSRILRLEWGRGAGGSGCGLAYRLFSCLPKSRVFRVSFSRVSSPPSVLPGASNSWPFLDLVGHIGLFLSDTLGFQFLQTTKSVPTILPLLTF